MKKHFFTHCLHLFASNCPTSRKAQKRLSLRFEPLEERQMLSVTPPCLENQTVENPPVELASPLLTESVANLSSFERNVTDPELSSNFSRESMAPIAMVAKGNNDIGGNPKNTSEDTTVIKSGSISTVNEGEISTGPISIKVAPGTKEVHLKYRFITSEVPGGYYGSKFNDYYMVTLSSGSNTKSDTHSMNELALGAFEPNTGATKWMTLKLYPDSNSDTITFVGVVANVGDSAYDSTLQYEISAKAGIYIESITVTNGNNPSLLPVTNSSVQLLLKLSNKLPEGMTIQKIDLTVTGGQNNEKSRYVYNTNEFDYYSLKSDYLFIKYLPQEGSHGEKTLNCTVHYQTKINFRFPAISSCSSMGMLKRMVFPTGFIIG